LEVHDYFVSCQGSSCSNQLWPSLCCNAFRKKIVYYISNLIPIALISFNVHTQWYNEDCIFDESVVGILNKRFLLQFWSMYHGRHTQEYVALRYMTYSCHMSLLSTMLFCYNLCLSQTSLKRRIFRTESCLNAVVIDSNVSFLIAKYSSKCFGC